MRLDAVSGIRVELGVTTTSSRDMLDCRTSNRRDRFNSLAMCSACSATCVQHDLEFRIPISSLHASSVLDTRYSDLQPRLADVEGHSSGYLLRALLRGRVEPTRASLASAVPITLRTRSLGKRIGLEDVESIFRSDPSCPACKIPHQAISFNTSPSSFS